ncbi:hypothetical protein BDQ17DRAFT_1331622 [Cyathus striatus]|nr:hypothetical protein BDQ17DRAFT_1331622 [Cyathus striatus]
MYNTQPIQQAQAYEKEVRELEQELAQWDNKYPTFGQPSRSTKFIGYGLTLLKLLKGPAGLHPALNAISVTFQSILSLAQESKENDQRVSGVFHAKIDMLLVIADWVNQTNKDITEAAQAIEVYRGQCHFVHFFKAEDWKKRFKEFADGFRHRKSELQLDLQITTSVQIENIDRTVEEIKQREGNMEKKIDALLYAFTDHDARLVERAATLKIRQPLASVPVAEIDDQVLVELIAIAGGPGTKGLDPKLLGPRDSADYYKAGGEENEESKRRQRLYDEGWMFCVESKIFVIALFEYYLDKFSARRRIRPGLRAGTSVISPTILTQIAYGSISDYISHPDAWTLEYFIKYVKYICQEVDTDYSGFIRISEANEFTENARALGVSLPQWCAYCATGWRYELQIYQARIYSLLEHIIYQQLVACPENRVYLSYVCNGYLIGDLKALVRGPLNSSWTVSDQLEELVNKKLFTALLEHCVEVFYVASANIIDYREIEAIQNNFEQLRSAAIDRLSHLKGKFGWGDTDSTLNIPLCDSEEISHFLGCFKIAERYKPLAPPPSTIEDVLKYSTWETYKKSIPEDQIPEKIPITWSAQRDLYTGDREVLEARFNT